MTGIPRFNAQLQALQVPSMRNYQAEQNASIAQSLSKFGSDIMSGIVNAKKQRGSKYYELEQMGKTVSGIDDTDEKELGEQTIKESFNTSFYNDAFDALGNIAKENKDNPAEIELQSNAYIDGVLSDIPEKQQKSIRESLNYLKDAWSGQSLQQYNEKQLSGARDEIIANMGKAKQIAISSMEQGAPEEVQMASSMNYMENIEKARQAKEITDAEAIKLKESFGQNIIVNKLGDILRDKSLSAKERATATYKFIDGKTGDEFIDTIMSPTERIAAVNKILDMEKEMNSFEKAQKEAAAEFFQGEMRKARRDVALTGAKDPQKIAQWQRYLNSQAQTEADFNDVRSLADFTFPSSTSPVVLRQIQKMKQDGAWSNEKLDELIEKNLISASDIKKYGDELNNPLEMNMKLVSSVDAEARYRLNYNDQNQAPYNKFLSILQSNSDFSTKPLSQQQAIAKANDALLEALKVAPVAKEQRRQEFSLRTTEAGLPYEDMQDVITRAKEQFPQKKDVSYADLEPYIEKELKDKMEIRKKNRIKLEIRGADGEIITDENLILSLQKALVKKEIEEGE